MELIMVRKLFPHEKEEASKLTHEDVNELRMIYTSDEGVLKWGAASKRELIEKGVSTRYNDTPELQREINRIMTSNIDQIKEV